MNHTEAVEQMLRNLNDWRNLPKFQLERRSDLFFGLFIRQIVAGYIGCSEEQIHPVVIPEFPFRHNVNKSDTNHTVNFDYVLFSDDGKVVYILELKTDTNSVDASQLEYLGAAAESQFSAIIEGIKKVRAATKHPEKYDHLFHMLENIKLDTPEIRLLYLTPHLDEVKLGKIYKIVNKDKINIITFVNCADTLEKTGGAVECHFASYLRRWDCSPAGSVCND